MPIYIRSVYYKSNSVGISFGVGFGWQLSVSRLFNTGHKKDIQRHTCTTTYFDHSIAHALGHHNGAPGAMLENNDLLILEAIGIHYDFLVHKATDIGSAFQIVTLAVGAC
jgi:hypothetical protein